MSRALTRDGAATREGKDGIGALVKPGCILSVWAVVLRGNVTSKSRRPWNVEKKPQVGLA